MCTGYKIAIHVINWSHNNQFGITNLRLQKLLYFLQGEYFRSQHKRLIQDEFYAWKLGPVIPRIYSQYSIYSSSNLPRQPEDTPLESNISSIVDQILIQYSKYTTWQLVNLSHLQDPWKYNYQIFGDGAIIPFESIKNYYKSGDEA